MYDQGGGTYADWLVLRYLCDDSPFATRTLVEHVRGLFRFPCAVSSNFFPIYFPFPFLVIVWSWSMGHGGLGLARYFPRLHFRVRRPLARGGTFTSTFPRLHVKGLLYGACITERRSYWPWKARLCHGHMHEPWASCRLILQFPQREA